MNKEKCVGWITLLFGIIIGMYEIIKGFAIEIYPELQSQIILIKISDILEVIRAYFIIFNILAICFIVMFNIIRMHIGKSCELKPNWIKANLQIYWSMLYFPIPAIYLIFGKIAEYEKLIDKMF